MGIQILKVSPGGGGGKAAVTSGGGSGVFPRVGNEVVQHSPSTTFEPAWMINTAHSRHEWAFEVLKHHSVSSIGSSHYPSP
jgi:hypothetical protein